MAGLDEVCGIELIERISKENFRNHANPRIWSEDLNSWGFFCDDINDLDRLYIIGCATQGDMILPDNGIIWKPVDKRVWEPYKLVSMSLGFGIILGKDIDEKGGNPIIKVSFLLGGDNSGIYDIFVPTSIAYKMVWDMVGK
jgi:hypothetical protein